MRFIHDVGCSSSFFIFIAAEYYIAAYAIIYSAVDRYLYIFQFSTININTDLNILVHVSRDVYARISVGYVVKE